MFYFMGTLISFVQENKARATRSLSYTHFHRFKKQKINKTQQKTKENNKIVRSWQGLEKRFMAS